MANAGLTPRQLLKITNEQSEDEISEEEIFRVYFNSAIDEVNAAISTNFPSISDAEMDIAYPNITIDPNYATNYSYTGLVNNRQIAPKRIYNFDTWIQFLEFKVSDITKNSAAFGYYQIQGGNTENTSNKINDNIYRIKISFTIKDGVFVLRDVEDAFKVFRLESGETPLTFGFQQEGNTLNLYVNPTTSPQQLLTPITVSSYIDNSVDNIELVDDIIVTDIMPPGYIGLDYYRRKYSLHAKWCNKLFIPIIIKTIRLYEGDTAELISLEQQVSSKSLNSFRNEVRKTLPLILYNPKKKYGDDN